MLVHFIEVLVEVVDYVNVLHTFMWLSIFHYWYFSRDNVNIHFLTDIGYTYF